MATLHNVAKTLIQFKYKNALRYKSSLLIGTKKNSNPTINILSKCILIDF